MSASAVLADLLATGVAADFLKYCYPGSAVTGRALQDSDIYRLYGPEAQLLEAFCQHWGQRPFGRQSGTLVDLGCGDVHSFRSKIAPLMNRLGMRRYVGVDVAGEHFDTIARSAAARAWDAEFLQSDIFAPIPALAGQAPCLALMLGQTLGNLPVYSPRQFPRQAFVGFFKAIRETLPGPSIFAFSIDTERDLHVAAARYRSPISEDLICSGVHRAMQAATDEPPPENAFRLLVGADQAAQCVTLGIRTIAPLRCRIGGRSITVPAHKDLIAGVSYRLGVRQLQAILKDANCPEAQVLSLDRSSLILATLSLD